MRQEITFEKNGMLTKKVFNTAKKEVFEIFRTIYGTSYAVFNRSDKNWILTNERGTIQIVVDENEIKKFL